MKILKLFSTNNPLKIDLCLEELGLFNVPNNDKEIVLDEVAKYVFDTTTFGIYGERVFDLELDYEYYFCDFRNHGINLNKDEIDWWEFDKLLAGYLLDKHSTISTVIGYRTYEKPPENPKTSEEREHKWRMEMKRKYALPNPSMVENGLEKLWNYTEKKVGEVKE